MKKLFLSILVLGLLLSGNAYAKKKAGYVYFKDDKTIHVKFSFGNKARKTAVAHCQSLSKFAFIFWNDEGIEKSRLYHCSKSKLVISPLNGDKLLWTNYNPEHVWAKEDALKNYKSTCAALGFQLGTEKFADCTLKLILNDEKKVQAIKKIEAQNEAIRRSEKQNKKKAKVVEYSGSVNCIKYRNDLYCPPPGGTISNYREAYSASGPVCGLGSHVVIGTGRSARIYFSNVPNGWAIVKGNSAECSGGCQERGSISFCERVR